MNAEIIAVGSEMLTPQKLDTNSLFLTDQLNALGIEVVQKQVVGDDRARVAEAAISAVGRSQIVIVTGGLGPTEDDVTRDAVAAALGRELEYRPEIYAAIEDRFRRALRQIAPNNKRQAYVVGGAEVLPNDRGTAPGQWIELSETVVILLPGPPKELKAMWELQCGPRLTAKVPPLVIRTRFYRVAGMPESDLDQLIAPIYTRYANPTCTILAAASDIQIHLRARCQTCEEADALLDQVGGQIKPLLGDRLYTDVGEPMEVCIGNLLAARRQTVSVAESCTGGMLAERITSVAGSSRYFAGGYLTYTNEAKWTLLEVSRDLLRTAGPVSDEVAHAMATAAREKMRADYGISITGIAGPDGGTVSTPVGTVYIGVADTGGIITRRFHFLGDRSRVRIMAAQTAMDMLRLRILKQTA